MRAKSAASGAQILATGERQLCVDTGRQRSTDKRTLERGHKPGHLAASHFIGSQHRPGELLLGVRDHRSQRSHPAKARAIRRDLSQGSRR